ncbi:MAG: PIN domain-containing protein [Actinomycetota bacterium]|nr:PIN domain-containing protein [Actinomycetota bacterium]
MIALDTTVLVYAKGAGHPLRQPCRQLIGAVAERTIEATTTVEVVQEFAHVRARRRDRLDAARLAEDYADLLSPLLEVDFGHLRQGLRLFARSPDLGAFDAVLAAAAAAAGASALVSADAAFSTIPDVIAHVPPDAAGVARLLSA